MSRDVIIIIIIDGQYNYYMALELWSPYRRSCTHLTKGAIAESPSGQLLLPSGPSDGYELAGCVFGAEGALEHFLSGDLRRSHFENPFTR